MGRMPAVTDKELNLGLAEYLLILAFIALAIVASGGFAHFIPTTWQEAVRQANW